VPQPVAPLPSQRAAPPGRPVLPNPGPNDRPN
jgi:hypothetical protein